MLKNIDDNAEMQSKELQREISELRNELRSAIDRVSSRTKALEDRVESLDTRITRTSLPLSNEQLKKRMNNY
ncbi:hypothetical protein CesoFtcFv8_001883 [Champsocephalus esox]|uniref:Uncharacterized protein n=1 Tax=Champsocephalus esox TaxID=159716 RepID=A0AAN8CWT7_9TELE|nr:hypothetical protein CesoFtcFv8_001883 [Champsocephalus esox]